MKLLQLYACIASISMTFAAPLRKRQVEINDGLIANYALTLEFLEAEFYRQALAKFNTCDFDAAGFHGVRENVVRIFNDEKAHIKLLQGAIKAAGLYPVKQCNYTFPIDDVPTFLQLAQVIEGVGVSAYLGAVPFISSTTLLPAGGSILPVEARHNTFLLVANKGNPIPSAFDTPLSFNLVFTIASAFIASCPASSPPLPFTAFPPLVATTSAVKAGDIVTLGGAPLNNGTFAVVISGLNTFPVPLFNNQFIFPNDTSISGQVYLVLSTNGSVTDDQIRAGPAILNAN